MSKMGDSTVLVLSSITVPPLVVQCIPATKTITTAVSIKFNLAD